MDVTELTHRILEAFEEFEGVERDRWSQTEWTRRIKTALCIVGTKLGYSVCASNVPAADWGEFLYDVCWLDGETWLSSVPMVAECEWGNFGDIEDDFQKLLIARASLRVMVCDGWWQPRTDDTEGRATAETLRKWVREFEGSVAGDTYLLIVYEWRENTRRSWRYRLRVDRTGEMPAMVRLPNPSARPG